MAQDQAIATIVFTGSYEVFYGDERKSSVTQAEERTEELAEDGIEARYVNAALFGPGLPLVVLGVVIPKPHIDTIEPERIGSEED